MLKLSINKVLQATIWIPPSANIFAILFERPNVQMTHSPYKQFLVHNCQQSQQNGDVIFQHEKKSSTDAQTMQHYYQISAHSSCCLTFYQHQTTWSLSGNLIICTDTPRHMLSYNVSAVNTLGKRDITQLTMALSGYINQN